MPISLLEKGIAAGKKTSLEKMIRHMKRGDLLSVPNSLIRDCSEVGVGSFFQISKDRWRRNGLKLCEGEGLDWI